MNRSCDVSTEVLNEQMKLVDGLQIGNLQEQTLAVSENCRRLDGKNIVSPQTELSTRVLGRPVGAAVTIVPRLSEVRLAGISATCGSSGCEKSTRIPFS